MRFSTQRFNGFFLFFIIFIFLTAIFWLYQKHTIGNDSTISEWLINYQGGFTRRGIIGEISFQFASYFNQNLRFIIFLFQSILYLFYLLLIYFFIKDTPRNILTVLAIFSPIFILYPIAELEVLARKEVFLYVGFVIFLNLSNKKYPINIPLIYIFFIFPILCLIWEPFIFFFLFPVFIILIKNSKHSFRKILFKIFLSFSSSIITISIILFNLLSPEEHFIMEKSLMDNFGEVCYMSCSLLKDKASISSQFTSVYNSLSIEIIFRYLIVILIGFSALLILIFNSQLKDKLSYSLSQRYKWINANIIFISFIISLLPSIILFSSMTDWGRIVNLIYTFSILSYIYLLKNKFIYLDEKIEYFDNLYIHKNKIFLVFIFIFMFGWNQKTAMTGDVATNSLYKIIYNTSKKIFHFDGVRLFQDSPLINFHKKYIE